MTVPLSYVVSVTVIVVIVHFIWFLVREEKRTRYEMTDSRQSKYVIVCYDPHFLEAVLRFLKNKRRSLLFWFFRVCGLGKRNGLGLKREDFIIHKEPGGPTCLAHKDKLGEEFEHLKYKIEFTARKSPWLDEIILMPHQRCQYRAHEIGDADSVHPELDDVPIMVAEVKLILAGIDRSHIAVSVWHTVNHHKNQRRIEFNRIELAEKVA